MAIRHLAISTEHFKICGRFDTFLVERGIKGGYCLGIIQNNGRKVISDPLPNPKYLLWVKNHLNYDHEASQ